MEESDASFQTYANDGSREDSCYTDGTRKTNVTELGVVNHTDAFGTEKDGER